MAKLGTLFHIKGFILNKLFEKGCFSSRRSGKHGAHMPERDLRTGYSPRYHELFQKAVQELSNEGLIHGFAARTGRDSKTHVTLIRKELLKGRPLINAFRESVGLCRLRRDFKEFSK